MTLLGCNAGYHNFLPCTILILSVKTVSISSVYIDFFLKGPCLFQEESEVIEKQMDKYIERLIIKCSKHPQRFHILTRSNAFSWI